MRRMDDDARTQTLLAHPVEERDCNLPPAASLARHRRRGVRVRVRPHAAAGHDIEQAQRLAPVLSAPRSRPHRRRVAHRVGERQPPPRRAAAAPPPPPRLASSSSSSSYSAAAAAAAASSSSSHSSSSPSPSLARRPPAALELALAELREERERPSPIPPEYRIQCGFRSRGWCGTAARGARTPWQASESHRSLPEHSMCMCVCSVQVGVSA